MQVIRKMSNKNTAPAVATLLMFGLLIGAGSAGAAPAAEKFFSMYVGESVVWEIGRAHV